MNRRLSPKSPLEEAVHVVAVLHEEGPVQPKLSPQALRRLRVILVAHHHPNGVARAVMPEGKGDQPHGQEQDRQEEQPSDDVYPHEPVSPRRSGRSHTAPPSALAGQTQGPPRSPHDTLSHPKRQRTEPSPFPHPRHSREGGNPSPARRITAIKQTAHQAACPTLGGRLPPSPGAAVDLDIQRQDARGC